MQLVEVRASAKIMKKNGYHEQLLGWYHLMPHGMVASHVGWV